VIARRFATFGYLFSGGGDPQQLLLLELIEMLNDIYSLTHWCGIAVANSGAALSMSVLVCKRLSEEGNIWIMEDRNPRNHVEDCG